MQLNTKKILCISFFQKTQAMQLQLLYTSGASKIWQKNWPKPVGHRNLSRLIGALLLPAYGFYDFHVKTLILAHFLLI